MAGAPKQKLKNLPKRVGNEHRKAKRAESWARGQKKKAERRAEQNARAAANRAAQQ
jgi:hypothetical protein